MDGDERKKKKKKREFSKGCRKSCTEIEMLTCIYCLVEVAKLHHQPLLSISIQSGVYAYYLPKLLTLYHFTASKMCACC